MTLPERIYLPQSNGNPNQFVPIQLTVPFQTSHIVYCRRYIRVVESSLSGSKFKERIYCITFNQFMKSNKTPSFITVNQNFMDDDYYYYYISELLLCSMSVPLVKIVPLTYVHQLLMLSAETLTYLNPGIFSYVIFYNCHCYYYY
jgi:hypothetical protein